MRYYIYWKNQLSWAPPMATIDAKSPEAALAQFKRELPRLIQADQVSIETTQRTGEYVIPWG